MLQHTTPNLGLLSLQYELALLIGQHLRLTPMLRAFLPTALKLLECRAGHVWVDDGKGLAQLCFSFPQREQARLNDDPALAQIIDRAFLADTGIRAGAAGHRR